MFFVQSDSFPPEYCENCFCLPLFLLIKFYFCLFSLPQKSQTLFLIDIFLE
eukprot:UN15874